MPNELSPGTTFGNALGQAGASGSHSNSALATTPPGEPVPATEAKRVVAVKISRALASGPRQITRDATVAEMTPDGQLKVLRQGTNDWTCFPGDENTTGNVPMCADPAGLQWMTDLMTKKPAPTNKEPGLIYMLCGAVQYSTTDPFDRSGPGIPVGPHYMIIWPFNARRHGLPNTVRDAGAWVFFDGTPFAHLHVCGTPWVGNEYQPGVEPVWTMQYPA